MEETESVLLSSFELLNQRNENQQTRKVDSNKDNNTISTILRTDNTPNLQCSLTNLDNKAINNVNRHNRILSNETQFNTLNSKESSTIYYSHDNKHSSVSNNQAITSRMNIKMNLNHYNLGIYNQYTNQSDIENDILQKDDLPNYNLFIPQKEKYKLQSNMPNNITVPRNNIMQNKTIPIELTTTNESKEYLQYKERMSQQFDIINSEYNNYYKREDSTSAKEIIKSLKNSKYQTYYSSTDYCDSHNKESKNINNKSHMISQQEQPYNSVLQKQTKNIYKRKRNESHSQGSKQKEENEESVIKSLFKIDNTINCSNSNNKYSITKIDQTNLKQVNIDNIIANEIAKDYFIEKRNKKKQFELQFENKKKFTINLFDNINALKSLSPENYNVQLTDQIDKQIPLTNYAMQRSQENRLNDFIVKLKHNNLINNMYVTGKNKKLKYISPIRFETYYKE